MLQTNADTANIYKAVNAITCRDLERDMQKLDFLEELLAADGLMSRWLVVDE
ncbi:hypothetical protein [Paenibacillus sp. FSL H7-0918]|uniref:hypothetical protein n=1 Tax=Paenibacillus sp. FSL H7-0918 TaxID=2921442 RepID=UPI0030F970B0